MRVNKTWRYICHFFAIILITTNSVFLITNIRDWQINVSESTILLSVIGCLFAFTAINMYSIFNTTIDTQKEKAEELRKEYESLHKIAKKQLNISIEIVRFQTTIFAISSTEKMNSQFLEWLDMAKKQVKNFIPLFNDFHDNVSKEDFDSVYTELAIVVNNSIHLLDSQKTIISQDDFWKDHKPTSTKQIALKDINDIRNKMNGFLNYDFENKKPFNEESSVDNQTEIYSGKKHSFFSGLFNFIKRLRKKK